MQFTLDLAQIVQVILSVFLPILVGLVTKKVTSGGTKAVLLASLTLLTSVFTELGSSLSSGTVFDLGVALVTAVPFFAISVAIHYGLWKPTGVAESVANVGNHS